MQCEEAKTFEKSAKCAIGFLPLADIFYINLPGTLRSMSKEAVRKPQLAGLVKAVIQNQNQLDPWLEFPQSSCCFKFGEAKRPLPIGALYLLWERDKRWSKPCRYCQGDARGLSCGGFLSTGWFEFICLDCSAFFVELWRSRYGARPLKEPHRYRVRS